MSDPNINHLNRVSEAMIIPNIIQFLQIEGSTVAGATMRGGINFKHASGSTSGGEAIYFTGGDSAGGDLTDIQLVFNAIANDLEDVDTTTDGGGSTGHMLIFNDATEKYESHEIQGHVSLVDGGGTIRLNVDVVGITNLNVATHGSSGHILFNNDGGLNFIEPVLSHLGDVNISSVADTHLLIYNNSNSRFENKLMSGDATIAANGALTIGNNKVGYAELDLASAGSIGQVLGSCGGQGGGFQWVNKVVNIADISGPPAGQTAIMVHDGATASFQEGLNIPNLPVSLGGNCGGFVETYAVAPSIGVGSNNVLGVTGDGSGGKVWTFLNVTEIGTGATGLAGLNNISLNTIVDGHLLIGDSTGDGLFQNFAVSGDATLAKTGALTIGNAKVTNAKLANPGLTLSTPDGSGLTYSAGGGTNRAGAGMTLGGDHSIKVNVDASTIEINSNTLRVKGLGIDTAQLKDDAVDADKLAASAVVNASFGETILNSKLTGNGRITVAADSGSNDPVSLGETITFTGTDPIDTTVGSNSLTISIDDATTSAKGAASFSSGDFTVSSGAVSLKTGGVDTNKIADDAVNAAKIADDAIGLSAMNLMSGQHGASGHVMIRFGDGTNQEFGFVPQSSVTASLKLNDITDVYTGATGAHHVLKVKDGGGGFTTAQLDHSHMANIAGRTVLGNNSDSASAPSELNADALISLINTGGTQFSGDRIASGNFATLSGSNTFTGTSVFQNSIQVGDGNDTDLLKMRGGHILQAATHTTGGWARGHLWSGTSNWSDGSSYPYLGGFGMYGSGSSNSATTMWISAESSNHPWQSPSMTIDTSGRVGINMTNYETADTNMHLDVKGKLHTSEAAYFGTDGGAGKNHVIIGSKTLPFGESDANFLYIDKGSDGESHVVLDHGTASGDFGAIYFGEYTDEDFSNGDQALILGQGSGSTGKIAVRSAGIFRVSNQNETRQWFQVENDGQISIGHHNSSDPDRARAGTILDIYPYATNSFTSWTDSNHVPLQELTTRGTIHIDPYGVDADTPGAGGAMTFGAQDNADRVVAGIYVPTNAGTAADTYNPNYGSKMIFATTNSYADGAKRSMWIDNNGSLAISKVDGRADASAIVMQTGGYEEGLTCGLFVEHSIVTRGSMQVRGSAGNAGERNGGLFSTNPSTDLGQLFFTASGPVLRHKHESNAGSHAAAGPYVWMGDNQLTLSSITDSVIGGHGTNEGTINIQSTAAIKGYGEGIMPFVWYIDNNVQQNDERYNVGLTDMRLRGADCIVIEGDALQFDRSTSTNNSHVQWYLGDSTTDARDSDDYEYYWLHHYVNNGAGWRYVYQGNNNADAKMMGRSWGVVLNYDHFSGGVRDNHTGVSFDVTLKNIQRNMVTPAAIGGGHDQLNNNSIHYEIETRNWWYSTGKEWCRGYWQRQTDVTNWQMRLSNDDGIFIGGRILARVVY